MNAGVLVLAASDDSVALLVWLAIILGPAALKIGRRLLGGAVGEVPSKSAARPAARGRQRSSAAPPGQPSAVDLEPGKEFWKRLLAGEDLSGPPVAEPTTAPPRARAEVYERASERGMPGMAAGDEALAPATRGTNPVPAWNKPSSPERDAGEVAAYSVDSDAYALAGQDPGTTAPERSLAARERSEGRGTGEGQAVGTVAATTVPTLGLRFDRDSLRAAVLWSEVLGPPLALRGAEVPGGPAGPGGEAHL